MKKVYKSMAILGVLFLIGIWLRYGELDLVRFEHEMVRDVVESSKILEGEVKLHGFFIGLNDRQQATFGPLAYYLTAIGLLIAKNNMYYFPLGGLIIIILLDLIGGYVAYRIGKDFFNETVGLIAAGFYLISPWEVFHVARVISPTDFLPLFATIFVYSCFKFFIEKKDKYLLLLVASIALQTHLHLSSLLLLPTTGIIWLIFKRKISLKYLIVGCLIGLLILAPYIYYSIKVSDFTSTFKHVASRDQTDFFRNTVKTIGIPIMFLTPYFGEYMLGSVKIVRSKLVNNYFLIITAITTLLALWGMIYIMIKARKEAKYRLLAGLFFIPLALYIIKNSNVTPHYFFMLLPLPMIVAAVAAERLMRKWKIMTITMLCVIVLSNVLFAITFLKYVENEGGTQGIFGTTYRNKMEVVNAILKENQDPLLVYYDGQKPLIMSMNYLFEINRGGPVRSKIIESFDEFKEGYLVLDRISFYSRYTGKYIPAEDLKRIDEEIPIKIKQIEMIKK